MRPCNQCRQPIENSQIVCAECEKLNEQEGRVAKPTVKLNTEKLSAQPSDVPRDDSMAILAITFNVVLALLGGMIGLYMGSWEIALAGAMIGIVGANSFMRMWM